MRPLLALALACSLSCARSRAAQTRPEEPPAGELPQDVTPLRYSLELSIDAGQPRFAGSEEIALQLERPRSLLWLHARDLHVAQASLVLPSGERLEARFTQVDAPDAALGGVARIDLPREVGPGKATLQLTYDAPFDPQLVGVYRSTSAGRGYVFSKFEAIYARRAFPCFDEPSRKAPFALTLIIPAGDQAVANTPLLEEKAEGAGRKRLRFAETPPLPTYLVAFAVGEFDFAESSVPPDAVRAAPLPLRGVAVRGNGPKLAFALRQSQAAITEMERYFGIPFPYPKLDLIAVPDFQSGAMENAGAITFRDQLLLLDEAHASLEQRISITSVVTHELAHQWFGDLVTMRWWDDLWLNEGFATWMDARTVQARWPEMQRELEEVRSAGAVMDQDELVSARKIRQAITNTHDITNAFDGITYQKGAAILAMFDRWVGREKFRLGLQDDLRSHENGNATTGDLLASLSHSAGRDLTGPFGSFLDQPGLPLLEVTVRCEAGQGSLLVRQSRSLPVGSKGSRDQLWQVPVCARYEAGGAARETCALVTQQSQAVALEGGCPAWVLPNAEASGYYRWSLDPAALQALREVGYRSLSTVEKISLTQNLKSAWRSAALPAGAILAALESVARDEHGAVAEQPMSILGFAHDELFAGDAALQKRVEKDARNLYWPALQRLGYRSADADTTEVRDFREQLVRFLAFEMDDAQVLGDLAKLGRAYLGSGAGSGAAAGAGGGDPGSGAGGSGAAAGPAALAVHPELVDPDLVGVALEAAVLQGDAAFWDAALARLLASEDSELRARLLVALSGTHDPALSQRALALALDERLRQNERPRALFTQLGMVQTREQAWKWLQANFDVLEKVWPDRYPGFLLLGLGFCDARHEEEVRAFFAPRVEHINGGPRNLATALEGMQLCAARAAAQGPGTRAYFGAR